MQRVQKRIGVPQGRRREAYSTTLKASQRFDGFCPCASRLCPLLGSRYRCHDFCERVSWAAQQLLLIPKHIAIKTGQFCSSARAYTHRVRSRGCDPQDSELPARCLSPQAGRKSPTSCSCGVRSVVRCEMGSTRGKRMARGEDIAAVGDRGRHMQARVATCPKSWTK